MGFLFEGCVSVLRAIRKIYGFLVYGSQHRERPIERGPLRSLAFRATACFRQLKSLSLNASVYGSRRQSPQISLL